MSEKSEMRRVPRKSYEHWVGFELKRAEAGSWRSIRGKAQGVDVNSFGLGFTTDLALEPGEILRLNLPLLPPNTDIPVFSEVCWAQPDGECYRIGLRFLY